MVNACVTEQQIPHEVAEFAAELRSLAALLDPAGGWYGVFAHRDPEGIRACLEGWEVPPWDVVQALLQDLAAQRGAGPAQEAAERLRQRYSPSVTAYDSQVGGREGLQDRLDVMLRERQYAQQRERELERAAQAAQVAGHSVEAERLSAELAWVRDDRQRAMSRCEELRGRLEAITARLLSSSRVDAAAAGVPAAPGPDSSPHCDSAAESNGTSARTGGTGVRARVRWGRNERRSRRVPRQRGMRYVYENGAAGPARVRPQPVLPAMPAGVGGTSPTAGLRGARYAGAFDDMEAERKLIEEQAAKEAGRLAEGQRAAAEAVQVLTRLRAEGRAGEAYAALSEVVDWPAEWLPLLAAEMESAGLPADVTTLLWELASLPPGPLVAIADAMVSAEREGDCAQLLRQSVARPPAEIAEVALGLRDAGRLPEAVSLLASLISARTPGEAAEVAVGEPEALVPLLLEAARSVSEARCRDVVGALRSAGVPGTP